jgi:hypothetical protein
MGHIERLLLDLGRIVRRPADVELRFAARLLLERNGDFGFARYRATRARFVFSDFP